MIGLFVTKSSKRPIMTALISEWVICKRISANRRQAFILPARILKGIIGIASILIATSGSGWLSVIMRCTITMGAFMVIAASVVSRRFVCWQASIWSRLLSIIASAVAWAILSRKFSIILLQGMAFIIAGPVSRRAYSWQRALSLIPFMIITVALLRGV